MSKLGWFYEQVCNILGTEERFATPGYLLGAIRNLQRHWEKRALHDADAELRERLREALGYCFTEASNDTLMDDVKYLLSRHRR